MRRHITVHGWSTGLVDPAFADRIDTEAVNSSLQECDNFIPEGSGAMSVRPQLKSVTGWKSWYTAIYTDAGKTYGPPFFWSYNYDGTSYAIATNQGYYNGLWRWASDGTIVYKGDLGSFSNTRPQMASIGKTVFFAKAGEVPCYSSDMTSASQDTAQFNLYKEISGVVETCIVFKVKIVEPLTLTVPDSIPVVGDVVYRESGATPIGVVRRVRTVEGEDGDTQDLWVYEIVVGVFHTIPSVGNNVTFSVSDCIGEVTAIDSSVQLFGTGTYFRSEFVAYDYVRLAGSDYQISAVTDDNLMDMTTVIPTRFEGLRAAARIATSSKPYFRAVGVYQGRVVWGGNSRTVSDTLVGTDSALCFSSSYDPYVIAAAPQVIPDPASPFFTTISVSSSAVLWIKGGDTLFFGTSDGEFAVEPGPIGATSELFPRIKRISSYGSTVTTPVIESDGRIITCPRSGGDIISYSYIDTNDRYNAVVLNPLCPSIITNGANSIAVRPRSDSSTAKLIFVLDEGAADGVRVGSIQAGTESVAWSNLVFDAAGAASPAATFAQVLEFDKDVYLLLKMSNVTGTYCLCKLDYAATTGTTIGFAADFLTACTNTSGNTFQVNSDASTGGMRSFLASKQVAVFGRNPAAPLGTTPQTYQYVFYGLKTLSGTGTFTAYEAITTGTPAVTTNTPYTEVVVGLPVYARMVPARVMVEDEEGSSLGRRIRLVSVSPSVLNTRQLIMNNTGVIPDRVDGYENPLKTDHIKRYYMGWLRDRDIEIEAAPGYSATIKSLTYEVSV